MKDRNARPPNRVEERKTVRSDLSHVGCVETEPHLTEAALTEKDAFHRLLEQIPGIFWSTDRQLRVTSSLGAGLAALNLQPNQLVGTSLFDYLQSQDPEFLPIAAHLRALKGESVACEGEWMGRSYQTFVEPLRRPDGTITGCLGIALDITERKRLEAQLRQLQKMEAVSRLTSGIAHDFNNLLTVILGQSDVLSSSLLTNEELRQGLEVIKAVGERAATLTRQLMAFSRRQLQSPRRLNLNTVVADLEKMLARLLGENIQLVVLPDAALRPVRADPGQMEQVLLNLAVNARDAMPHGGKLTIATGNIDLDENYTRLHPEVLPGSYSMVAVSDTGCGMPEEVRAHLFEPFFTTKEKGKGTGLGLATVYGIIKQSGGHIAVSSEPERGTTFTIYLPQAEVP